MTKYKIMCVCTEDLSVEEQKNHVDFQRDEDGEYPDGYRDWQIGEYNGAAHKEIGTYDSGFFYEHDDDELYCEKDVNKILMEHVFPDRADLRVCHERNGFFIDVGDPATEAPIARLEEIK